MSTAAQILANQANCKLSTGPVTEAGKQTVSANAVKHGLTGNSHAVLPGEAEAFEKHLESYRKTYAPASGPEADLLRTLAENYWRLRRAHQLETALFQQIIQREEYAELDPLSAQAQAWSDRTTGLQRMALYATRIQRAIEKTAVELKSVQAARKSAYAQAEEEAILLTRLAQSAKQPFDPAEHFPSEGAGGFVYSRSEIESQIRRAARLEEAKRFFQAA